MRLQTKRIKDGSIHVHAYEGRKVVGKLNLHPRYTHGRDLLQVVQVNVLVPYQRQGVGTKLYEEAARVACEEGIPLASSPRWMRSKLSTAFWDKQARKGRVTDIGEGIFVVNESCGADLSGIELPHGCRLRKEETGSKTSAAFRIECDNAPRSSVYPMVGRIRIHKLRQKIRSKTVYSVTGINVDERYRRKGFATLLYESAAKEACRRRAHLASTERNTDALSLAFWLKQERKGRAVRVRQPRKYNLTSKEHAPDMYDAFLLDCAHAGDLSGFNLELKKRWPWYAGGTLALALLLFANREPPFEVDPSRKRFGAILDAAADKYGVPRSMLRAVAWVESRWNPVAGSGAGAVGLLQLMPQTAQSLGVYDRTDPKQNAEGGAEFLASLQQKAGSWPVALAAYNWGPGNVFGNNTRAPSMYSSQWPAATQQYVRNVLEAQKRGVV